MQSVEHDIKVAPDLWAGDRLERQKDAEIILNMVRNRAKSMARAGDKGAVVLNVDAAWGDGKTFLLERMARSLADEGKLVARVNAWEADYSDDPFPALVGPIVKALSDRTGEAKKTELKSIAKAAGRVVLNAGIAGLGSAIEIAVGPAITRVLGDVGKEALKAAIQQADSEFEAVGNALIENADKRQEAMAEFKSTLNDAMTATEHTEESIKLYVLVDELDRCRPSYSVAFLERIKHVFDVSGVAFIVATDTSQLTAAIRGVYGDRFDASTYLRRFFPLAYRLPHRSLGRLVGDFLDRNGRKEAFQGSHRYAEFEKLIAGIIAVSGASTRDTEAVFAQVELVVAALGANRCFLPLIVYEVVKQNLLDGRGTRWPRNPQNSQLRIRNEHAYRLADRVFQANFRNWDSSEASMWNIVDTIEHWAHAERDSAIRDHSRARSEIADALKMDILTMRFGPNFSGPDVDVPELVSSCSFSKDRA